MRTAKLSSIYFSLVSAAGFLFGAAREFWVAPWLSPRGAILIELPLLLLVSFFFAMRIVRTRLKPLSALECALVGIIAFALLLCAETAVGLGLRRMSWTRATFLDVARGSSSRGLRPLRINAAVSEGQ